MPPKQNAPSYAPGTIVEGLIRGCPKTPYWGCSRCGFADNWASRTTCYKCTKPASQASIWAGQAVARDRAARAANADGHPNPAQGAKGKGKGPGPKKPAAAAQGAEAKAWQKLQIKKTNKSHAKNM